MPVRKPANASSIGQGLSRVRPAVGGATTNEVQTYEVHLPRSAGSLCRCGTAHRGVYGANGEVYRAHKRGWGAAIASVSVFESPGEHALAMNPAHIMGLRVAASPHPATPLLTGRLCSCCVRPLSWYRFV